MQNAQARPPGQNPAATQPQAGSRLEIVQPAHQPGCPATSPLDLDLDLSLNTYAQRGCAPACEGAFEALYSEYPRKRDKGKALRVFLELEIPPEKLPLLKKAIERLKAENRPALKIPYFKNFLVDWEEFLLEPSSPATALKDSGKPCVQAWKIDENAEGNIPVSVAVPGMCSVHSKGEYCKIQGRAPP
jgi:hypothetical protein